MHGLGVGGQALHRGDYAAAPKGFIAAHRHSPAQMAQQ
jgi:hypothetical protein